MFVLVFCFAKYKTIALSTIENVIIVAIENKHTKGKSIVKLELYNFGSFFLFANFIIIKEEKLRSAAAELLRRPDLALASPHPGHLGAAGGRTPRGSAQQLRWAWHARDGFNGLVTGFSFFSNFFI